MPTYPVVATSQGSGELYRSWLINMGITPTSLGEGELLALLANSASMAAPVGGTAMSPANSVGQNIDRNSITGNTLAMAGSGTLQMVAVWLNAGSVVSNFNFIAGTTAATGPTHAWMGLYQGPAATPLCVCVSADATSAAIGASTVNTYAVAASNVSSSATSYTVQTSGIYYVGLLITVSTTMPTLQGLATTLSANTVPPILAGSSSTALTIPPTFPASVSTTITASTISYYTWLT